MTSAAIELDEDVIDLMRQDDRPIGQTPKELIVCELYRRGTISSGRGAELLGISLIDFIQHTSDLGIPFFDMTDEEWERERQTIEALWSAQCGPQ
jgi:predicted HTH domain antitoxin